MEIGIIGLPNSGKTTIYNALTRSDTSTAAFSSGQVEVHTAVVNVPDPRVDVLSEMFNPKKTIHARVTYNDIAGFGKGAAKSGLGGQLLNAMAANDALAAGRSAHLRMTMCPILTTALMRPAI